MSCIPAKMALQGKDCIVVIKVFVIFQEGGRGCHADPQSPPPLDLWIVKQGDQLKIA